MALRLFEHPLSPYARKVKLVLYEKGIPVERVFIDPNTPTEERDYQEFVLASPRLEVPALVDGATRVFESRVIVDYIEERWPDPPLMPHTPAERARVRMLETLCDGPIEAIHWGLMELVVFRRAEGERAEALRGRAAEQLERVWARLERELGSRDWFGGERFGRADATVWPYLGSEAAFGFPLPDRFPRLRDWQARCGARESVKREGAELSQAVRELSGGDPPRIVRQYRDHRLEWMLRSGGLDVVLEGLARGTIRFGEEP